MGGRVLKMNKIHLYILTPYSKEFVALTIQSLFITTLDLDLSFTLVGYKYDSEFPIFFESLNDDRFDYKLIEDVLEIPLDPRGVDFIGIIPPGIVFLEESWPEELSNLLTGSEYVGQSRGVKLDTSLPFFWKPQDSEVGLTLKELIERMVDYRKIELSYFYKYKTAPVMVKTDAIVHRLANTTKGEDNDRSEDDAPGTQIHSQEV